MKERNIDYPVALDNDYAIWSAFDNHYWPALYFVDTDGVIRDHHFGEGRYEQSESVIQRLLGVEREPVTVEGLGVEAAADWDHLRTPETYLDHVRSELSASPAAGVALDERRAYEFPASLRVNHWALAGEFTIGPRAHGGDPQQSQLMFPTTPEGWRQRERDEKRLAEIQAGAQFRGKITGLPIWAKSIYGVFITLVLAFFVWGAFQTYAFDQQFEERRQQNEDFHQQWCEDAAQHGVEMLGC